MRAGNDMPGQQTLQVSVDAFRADLDDWLSPAIPIVRIKATATWAGAAMSL
jgi:hypothetical protein